ncbi:MAG: family 20 glycosylhydrolase [Bacteroidota bacterium]
MCSVAWLWVCVAGALLATGARAQPVALLPAPLDAAFSQDAPFTIVPETPILVPDGDPDAHRIAGMLAELLSFSEVTRPRVVEARAYARTVRGAPSPALVFSADAPDSLGTEGYVLTIAPERITLAANAPAGWFYATQTLRQLLPPAVEYEAAFPVPLAVPAGRIVDRPRFGWRGMMLDVARHFFGPDDVRRLLDLMALHKLNRLHLHLSDDQGWRIEIPGWPRLTEVGGSTEVGGGPGGFFSLDEYAALVQYAAERYIIIVPEIDLPGHTNAALASYAELNCDGVAPPLYTGTSVGFSTVCVEREATYRFVEDVVRTLAEVTPGPYFHLGGDEVRELSPEQYATFMIRAQAIVEAHGKRVIGWDELAEVDLVPESIIQVWRPAEAETQTQIREAVEAGATVVLSPADRVYLDIKYDGATVLGLMWAGLNSVRDAYDWDPTALLPGVPTGAIEGIEAPLWSETISTRADLEFMAFPRLAGIADLAWAPAATHDWTAYRLRLGAQAPRWTTLGLNFYRSPDIPWATAPSRD